MKSKDIIQPTAMETPIANQGVKNTIPNSATGTGFASIQEGFPKITMKPISAGGLPPRGEDCNGMFYLSTDQKVFLQNGGIITFSQVVSDLIGGYPKGAILDYYNNTTNTYSKVISLIEDNTNNFVSNLSLIDNINWKYINSSGANLALSNLSDSGNDFINQSKAMYTGNVSNNPIVYADVEKAYHSSFDISKFTVVGNPTITADGVASNLSGSRYLNTKITSLNPTKDIRIKIGGTWGTTQTEAGVLFEIKNPNGQNAIRFYRNKYSKFSGEVGQYTLPTSYTYLQDSAVTTNNAEYFIDIIIDLVNNNISYDYYENEQLIGRYSKKITSINMLNDINWTDLSVTIGAPIYSSLFASIDLKQFSITVDGQLVFSDNITGIDIIKPDDYTVVGNPIISGEGIFNYINATSLNYIKAYENLPVGSNNIRIEYEGIVGQITDGLTIGNTCLTLFRQSGSSNNPKFGHFVNCSNILENQSTIWYNNSGELARHSSGRYASEAGAHYKAIYSFDAEKIYFELYVNGLLKVADYQLISDLGITALDCYIGSPNFVNRKHSSTLDLNSFKIYIDGKLVYQPCLKIPYTLTHGGAKIADMQYLDRVQDAYEQGYTEYQYLTIDEENQKFTLPQGMSVYEGIANNTALALKNKTRITNCILGMPNRVKFHISEGKVSLFAGSEVFVNNGNGFQSYVLQSNTAYGGQELWTNDSSRILLLVYIPDLNIVTSMAQDYVFNSSSAPTSFLANTALWYNPDNQQLKCTIDGGSTWRNCSLPLMYGKPISGRGWLFDIESIFNGFGFFGQNTFCLPGVKYLSPNGKNSDYSLNNLEKITTKVVIRNCSGRTSVLCFLDKEVLDYGVNNYFEQDMPPSGFGNSAFWLNTLENYMYQTDDGGSTWIRTNAIYLGNLFKGNPNTGFTFFQPVEPVELVKREQLERLKDIIDTNIANIFNENNNFLSEIGIPLPTFTNSLKDNEIWLTGGEVSKTTYDKLYAVYGDKFGTATTTDKFVLPNITDCVLWGSDLTGSMYIDAGLPDPNITVSINGSSGDVGDPGTYYITNATQFNGTRTLSVTLGNSVYGNSSTVQPRSIKVKFKTRYK